MSRTSSGILMLTVCLSITAQSHCVILAPHVNDTWKYEIMSSDLVDCLHNSYKIVYMIETIKIIDITQYSCCHEFVASYKDSGFVATAPGSYWNTNGLVDIPDSLKHDTIAVYSDTCNDTNGLILGGGVMWQNDISHGTAADSNKIVKGEYYGFSTSGSFTGLFKSSKALFTPIVKYLYIYSSTLGLIHFIDNAASFCMDDHVSVNLISVNNNPVDLSKIEALFTDSTPAAFDSNRKAAIQSYIKANHLVWSPFSRQIQCIRSDNIHFLINGKKLGHVLKP
jgi:hypothetical protein